MMALHKKMMDAKGENEDENSSMAPETKASDSEGMHEMPDGEMMANAEMEGAEEIGEGDKNEMLIKELLALLESGGLKQDGLMAIAKKS